MPTTNLKVIPASDAGTERTGTGGPLFRGTGDMDYLCGNCGAVVAEGFGPAQHVSVENAVCSTCGATNEFPQELRS